MTQQDDKSQQQNIHIRRLASNVKAIYFDVDGTLIDDSNSGGSVWKKIHQLAGVTEETREERYQLYKAKQLSYEEWMQLDISSWQNAGITKKQISLIISELRLYDGVKDTISRLYNEGYKLGIISSSIDIGIFSLLDPNLFTEKAINKLFFDEEGRIASWDTSACRLEEKGEILKYLAKSQGLTSDQVAFIGNDFNDIGAANFAGLSFSFSSVSPELDSLVNFTDRTGDMRNILKFFI